MGKSPARSWTEKFESSKPHEVKPVPINIAGMKKGEIMLVPSPRIVADFIARIPAGESMDVRTLRERLARRYKAEVTCPITTGFHLRTVAEAALEARSRGAALTEITPFWRVLDEHAPTTEKLSCGTAFVKKLRRREGLR
ncbi:hypothetical protein [Bradyrhizobium prioriisuperbiae]|uniref:hypothetical protein n=1 Tax=Bradyrhizobium prioriisuperbiae TaxID=2854389 RepID=UPI0028E45911|nr:hypothetical protein [Bradyrhizobium prioritasuperba]